MIQENFAKSKIQLKIFYQKRFQFETFETGLILLQYRFSKEKESRESYGRRKFKVAQNGSLQIS